MGFAEEPSPCSNFPEPLQLQQKTQYHRVDYQPKSNQKSNYGNQNTMLALKFKETQQLH